VCGLHRTYIGSIERGERNVSLKNINVLASALQTSGSALLALATGTYNRVASWRQCRQRRNSLPRRQTVLACTSNSIVHGPFCARQRPVNLAGPSWPEFEAIAH
jgi:hypothetical protein